MKQVSRVGALGVVLTGLLLGFPGGGWAATQLNLDGVDDFAREALGTTSPSALDVSTFTIEAWIYPTQDSSMPVVSNGAYRLWLVWDGLRWGIQFTLRQTATWPMYLAHTQTWWPNEMQRDSWNHVVGMFDVSTNTCGVGINGNLNLTSQ